VRRWRYRRKLRSSGLSPQQECHRLATLPTPFSSIRSKSCAASLRFTRGSRKRRSWPHCRFSASRGELLTLRLWGARRFIGRSGRRGACCLHSISLSTTSSGRPSADTPSLSSEDRHAVSMVAAHRPQFLTDSYLERVTRSIRADRDGAIANVYARLGRVARRHSRFLWLGRLVVKYDHVTRMIE